MDEVYAGDVAGRICNAQRGRRGRLLQGPKKKKGTEGGFFFSTHWLETPLCEVQEKIQAAAEARLNTVAHSGVNTLHSDKRPRPYFPVRPKKERLERGGGIGKMLQKPRPFKVKRKGRGVCLCHWHLEWELRCCVGGCRI
jgi:hypothetical protein